MKSSSLFKSLILLFLFLSPAVIFAQQEPRNPRPELAPNDMDFLGWEYDKVGYALNPGEAINLRFRNNLKEVVKLPVSWSLSSYTGKELGSGKTEISLSPGQTGEVPVALPDNLADGGHKIIFTAEHKAYSPNTTFYFDFRRPVPHKDLNITLVSFIENMDSEGWVRMMMGPLARYADIRHDWPANPNDADAVIVIAESLDAFNPRLTQLQNYVREGGVMIVFGQPAHILSGMLPITCPGSRYVNERLEMIDKPQQLKLTPEGPWSSFAPETGPHHYALKVDAKANAVVLAEWAETTSPDTKGIPAVVSGNYGEGKVIFVGTGAGQVWQNNPALEGADELALRILYHEKGGEQLVQAMLNQAELIKKEKEAVKLATRDFVFANMKTAKPNDFVVVGEGNSGRFGWLIHEGGLSESITESGVVSASGYQDWRLFGGPPMSTERKLGFSVSPGREGKVAKSGDVSQNWFAKTIEWNYGNGESLKSTISLGSPAILWEGKSTAVSLNFNAVSHLAYLSPKGMKTIAKGERINPADMKENWLLALSTEAELRDMPLMISLTKKPTSINFTGNLEMEFSNEGFHALFTSRLWGIKRLAPGETAKWITAFPADAITDARRWSQVFLKYPVKCDEIGWVEGETVLLADRFSYKEFSTDWKTKASEMIILPPVFFLAKNVGAPVQLPEGLTDMNFFSKYGPVKAMKGSASLVKIPLPLTDHRAIVPVKDRMIVQEEIDYRVAGLLPKSLQYSDANIRNEGGGLLQADLTPYDVSRAVPYYEAPTIDLYKWWYTLGAIQVRQVYGDSVRQVMDEYFHTRYLETLNLYSHKSVVMHKREPFTGNEYPITFVWPTQTNYGFRNFNDANEASGLNAYCVANYARYYGDWTTLQANWNTLRYHHDPLPKIHDWAAMCSGAFEFWVVAGLDMLNSEAFGSLSFAYAAERAGSTEDVILGKVLGARSFIPTVARLDLKNYITLITAEGDPMREFQGFYHFNEHGMQLTRSKMGGVGMLDTSKGTFHELSLAYKMWAGKRTNEEQIALAGGYNKPASNGSPDVTQRLILGWNIDSLAAGIRNPDRKIDYSRLPRWQESTSLYDLAILCTGDIPMFLSEWAPAEFLDGQYNEEKKELQLSFRSHIDNAFEVKIYSQYAPKSILVNGSDKTKEAGYDQKTGWLIIKLTGNDLKNITILFGEKVAPLHPYLTKL
jgi:hypothetical protein